MDTYEKKYKDANNKVAARFGTNVAKEIFTDLYESEDERMMHQLHSWMKEFGGAEEYTEKVYTWLKSLLEKQGQKPFDYENANIQQKDFAPSPKPKFHEGDWITCEELNTALIVNIDNDRYEVEFLDGNKGFPHIDYIDRLFHLWTIQDAKDGDVLYCKSDCGVEFIVMSKGVNNRNNIDSYFRYNSDDGFGIDIPNVFSAKQDNITPATKEQRDILFKKMKEAGYEWDAVKKELKKIEQKPADAIKTKFKVSDWVVNNNSGDVYLVTEIRDDEYCLWPLDAKIMGYLSIIDVDNDYHIWTIEDAKDGDVLCAKYGNDEMPFIFTGKQGDVAYCALNSFGEFVLSIAEWLLKISVLPATKEQRDILFAKMKEAGYTFDFEKKELKKINKNTDVGHEYFSDLLEKDDCDNIDDYAYQCAYCISHDWMKETATWEDVQKAVKLGAEWNERHHNSSWSEEDISKVQRICKYLNEVKKYYADINEVRECMEWLKSLEDRVLPQPKQKWKQENTDDLTDFENAMMHIGESFFGKNAGLDPNDTNTIKEQANTLLGLVPSKDWSEEDAVNFNLVYTYVPDDSLRDWLKELKDRVLPHPKQEWSEEDENYFDAIITKLEVTQEDAALTDNQLKFLKSLKYIVLPQNHWKPSDEQMDALDSTLQYSQVSHNSYEHLNSLYNDLKKLKGE